MSIRIGIIGYGNLGRGVECAVKQNKDMELVAVFTRRDPASVMRRFRNGFAQADSGVFKVFQLHRFI